MDSEELQEELKAAAEQAALHAYAPASRIRIGASLRTMSGKVYTGCNIENASYGLTLCAERVALFKAVSEGERDFSGMVIVNAEGEDAAPCGACRQALLEFAPDLEITYRSQGLLVTSSLRDLLPDPFTDGEPDLG